MHLPLVPLLVGSALGGLARYATARLAVAALGAPTLWGTVGANLAGCFLIGLLEAASEGRGLSPAAKALLVVGFCGAFTTFSTFALETTQLMRDGRMLSAAANVFGSAAAGLACVYLGMRAGRLLG